MFDTHCHLTFPGLKNQLDKITASDLKMITVGVDLKDSIECVKIAEKYDNVWASVGIHPIGANWKNIKADLKKIEKLLLHKKIVAIGEVGLDDKEKKIEINEQIELLKRFIKLAEKYGKPLILHSRGKGNIDKITDLLTTFHFGSGKTVGGKLRGVLHCFTGNIKQAKKLVELGYKIGLTNIVVNCDSYDKIIQEIDLSDILLETDAPFLLPKATTPQSEIYIKKRNNNLILDEIERRGVNIPQSVWFVVKKIAEIKGMPIGEVEKITDYNAHTLFNL